MSREPDHQLHSDSPRERGEVVFRLATRVLLLPRRVSLEQARDAFLDPPPKLGRLEERRRYGWIDGGRLRGCYTLLEGDDTQTLELEAGLLPGGACMRRRCSRRPESYAQEFVEAAMGRTPDPARPCLLEFGPEGEVWALLPVLLPGGGGPGDRRNETLPRPT